MSKDFMMRASSPQSMQSITIGLVKELANLTQYVNSPHARPFLTTPEVVREVNKELRSRQLDTVQGDTIITLMKQHTSRKSASMDEKKPAPLPRGVSAYKENRPSVNAYIPPFKVKKSQASKRNVFQASSRSKAPSSSRPQTKLLSPAELAQDCQQRLDHKHPKFWTAAEEKQINEALKKGQHQSAGGIAFAAKRKAIKAGLLKS